MESRCVECSHLISTQWLGHVLSSIVLHQDAGLLYFQSRNIRERGYNFAVDQQAAPADNSTGKASVAYERLTFCPTSVDKGVLAFRQWLRTMGGDGIPWQCPDVLPPRGTEDIYDMWHAHTKHCSHCRGALRNLNAAKYSSLGLLGVSALWMPDGGERTAAVLVAGATAAALHVLTGLFYRYEFSHADND